VFDDEETLRLLPKCSHVFHPDCIDTNQFSVLGAQCSLTKLPIRLMSPSLLNLYLHLLSHEWHGTRVDDYADAVLYCCACASLSLARWYGNRLVAHRASGHPTIPMVGGQKNIASSCLLLLVRH